MVLTMDPRTLVCPDNASQNFVVQQAALVNNIRTEEQAVKLLNTI